MDSSLSSSSPDPTVSGVKSIFNKPADISQGFEVSIDESVTAVPSNKSELELDTTSTEANKVLPFDKFGKSTQQGFEVSLQESVVNSECEESVTFAKPQTFLSKKRKSLVDFFNVSYNESLLPDDTVKSVDESALSRNPFKRRNNSHNELEIESSMQEAGSNDGQRTESACSFGDEADSTSFVTKENPFHRPDKQDSFTHLEVSDVEGNKTTDGENNEDGNLTDTGVDDEPNSDVTTKSNPFQHDPPLECNNSISVTEEISLVENPVLAEPNQTSRISIDRSITKPTNNSTSLLEQSSINDENLNNWMSDHSDEEMPPPRVPSVTANLSHTKEKPPVPDPVTTETNQMSVWEQKLMEIVSNAERKSKVPEKNINLTEKPKPFKKSDQNVKKPAVDGQKFKPKLVKPAPYATKKLYEYIIKRLKPKYGIDSVLEAENLVTLICDTVKKVTRRKTYQKRLIQKLKKEMSEAGLIVTTVDFYEFVIKFLPYNFRVKVVPCVQPVTNVVFPPKDGLL